MRYFRQRICLVKELRQLACSEERVDHRTQCSCIDEVYGRKDFIVSYVHTLTDSTRHTGQTYAELSIELFAHGTDTTVAQVIDIIDLSLGIRQTNEILDDLDHVFLRECLLIQRLVQVQLAVDLIPAYF